MTDSFLTITQDLKTPAAGAFEYVECKGYGHPDTLADFIASAVSADFARYCQQRFGCIPNHNVDKVVIRGGMFRLDYGVCEMKEPITVFINGRMANFFAGEAIPIETIQRDAVLRVLTTILPSLDVEHCARVVTNSTQHTRREHWFSPRGKEDLPYLTDLRASDNACIVSYHPLTPCEQLAHDLQARFWHRKPGELPYPKYDGVGQDIKLQVRRKGADVTVTAAVPLLIGSLESEAHYNHKIGEVRAIFQQWAEQVAAGSGLSVTTHVNPNRPYTVGTGSCIDFGEEGVVGRGNGANGLIATYRPFSAEAPAGKNLTYHTGRVWRHLGDKLARQIYDELGTPSTILAITENSSTLIPPEELMVSVPEGANVAAIEQLISSALVQTNHVEEILAQPWPY